MNQIQSLYLTASKLKPTMSFIPERDDTSLMVYFPFSDVPEGTKLTVHCMDAELNFGNDYPLDVLKCSKRQLTTYKLKFTKGEYHVI